MIFLAASHLFPFQRLVFKQRLIYIILKLRHSHKYSSVCLLEEINQRPFHPCHKGCFAWITVAHLRFILLCSALLWWNSRQDILSIFFIYTICLQYTFCPLVTWIGRTNVGYCWTKLDVLCWLLSRIWLRFGGWSMWLCLDVFYGHVLKIVMLL